MPDPSRRSAVFDRFVCVQMRTNVEKTTHCAARASDLTQLTDRARSCKTVRGRIYGVQVLPANTCCVIYTRRRYPKHKRVLIRFQFVNYWEMVDHPCTCSTTATRDVCIYIYMLALYNITRKCIYKNA